MTSIEAQKSFTSSSHLQNPAVSESQKENSQSTNLQKEHNTIDSVNKEKSKIVTTDIKDNVKDAFHITNCDQKKHENEEDVIILENNKKEVKCSINKIEHGQNAGKVDNISTVSENDSKINKNENAKETISRSANNLKRTRRNFA